MQLVELNNHSNRQVSKSSFGVKMLGWGRKMEESELKHSYFLGIVWVS